MKPQTFEIRRFLGIRNSEETSDLPRGSLRKAEGFVLTPSGALTGGPSWSSLLGGNVKSSIQTSLAAADATKVHFVTVTKGTSCFLIAWDKAAARSRGCWYVGPNNSDPTVSGILFTQYTDANWLNKTAALRWYGSWINGALWLGNGTDTNLIFTRVDGLFVTGGTLALLGPASPPADTDDLSKYRFPPCKQFVQTAEKVIYGAGNVTNPLYVYASEKATALYPSITGVLSLDTSFVKINHTNATAVNALQLRGGAVVAHTDAGAVLVTGYERGGDAYKAQQVPTRADSGACNPNCVSDSDGSLAYYLATDFELYRTSAAKQGNYGEKEQRAPNIATAVGEMLWNANMALNGSTDDFAVVHDRKDGLVFILASLSAGTSSGFYCYHEPDRSDGMIVGPIRYPDAVEMVMITVNERTYVAILTRAGVLMSAKLSDLYEADSWQLPSYGTALGAAYQSSGSAPTPGAGLPIAAVNSTTGALRLVIDSVVLGMASPWDQWTSGLTPTVNLWFNNANIAIFEVANEDFGDPASLKEFLQTRLQFQRNSIAYLGVFAESEGLRHEKWRGTNYPKEEQLSGLKLLGRRLTLRVVILYFNDQRFLLRGLGVDFLQNAPV